jgi:translation elongation factor EF-Ts
MTTEEKQIHDKILECLNHPQNWKCTGWYGSTNEGTAFQYLSNSTDVRVFIDIGLKRCSYFKFRNRDPESIQVCMQVTSHRVSVVTQKDYDIPYTKEIREGFQNLYQQILERKEKQEKEKLKFILNKLP